MALKENNHHQNTVLDALSKNPCFSRWAVGAFKESKMIFNEKARRVELHKYDHPTPLAATVFCVWGQTVDVIKHAKFQLNLFRGF